MYPRAQRQQYKEPLELDGEACDAAGQRLQQAANRYPGLCSYIAPKRMIWYLGAAGGDTTANQLLKEDVADKGELPGIGFTEGVGVRCDGVFSCTPAELVGSPRCAGKSAR